MFKRISSLAPIALVPSWGVSSSSNANPSFRFQSTSAAAQAEVAPPTESEAPPLRAVSRYRVKRRAQPLGSVNMKDTTATQESLAAAEEKISSTAPSAGTPASSSSPSLPVSPMSSPTASVATTTKKSLWGGTASSCADESEAPKKPLTALQRRMQAMADKPKFSLTPNALYRIKTLLQLRTPEVGESSDDAPIGIRVGVKQRGCSGLSYTVNYEPRLNPKRKDEDAKIEQSGIWVYVDADALFYVIGTNMDFTVSQVEEKFTFTNPNEKSSCGCGESFLPFDA